MEIIFSFLIKHTVLFLLSVSKLMLLCNLIIILEAKGNMPQSQAFNLLTIEANLQEPMLRLHQAGISSYTEKRRDWKNSSVASARVMCNFVNSLWVMMA